MTQQRWQRLTRVDLTAENADNAYELAARNARALTVHRSLRPLGFAANKMSVLLSALTWRTGQRAQVTFARKGAARLGLRAGAVSGAKVTLHGKRLAQFRDAYPRRTRLTDRVERPLERRRETGLAARYPERAARTVTLCWKPARGKVTN